MVTIGKILKPFGVRGQVRVECLSDVPDRFEGLESVTLLCTNGDQVVTKVQSVRQIGEGYILGLSAFSTPETASGFRGALIQIPEQPDLPRAPDTFYQFELMGLQVEDQQGQTVGTVEDVLDFPHQQVFVIKHDGQEWLLPARKEMIESIDIAKNRLRLASNELWDQSNAL
ncbi:MAG: ribosome maturation factor RimM [Nitrospirales bacterium]